MDIKTHAKIVHCLTHMEQILYLSDSERGVCMNIIWPTSQETEPISETDFSFQQFMQMNVGSVILPT